MADDGTVEVLLTVADVVPWVGVDFVAGDETVEEVPLTVADVVPGVAEAAAVLALAAEDVIETVTVVLVVDGAWGPCSSSKILMTCLRETGEEAKGEQSTVLGSDVEVAVVDVKVAVEKEVTSWILVEGVIVPIV